MRIEKTALDLFVENGVDAVTVDDIAVACGISRSTFYRYFEGPDDILSATPGRLFLRWARGVRDRPLDEPLLDSFRVAVRNLEISETEEGLQELAVRVARASPAIWTRASAWLQIRAHEIFQGIVAERLRASGKDPASANLIATALTAVMMHIKEHDLEGKARALDRIEQALTLLVEMMSAKVSGRAP